MQRRSREIPACLILLAYAATLPGCNERRDCVDANNRKTPDSYCSGGGHAGSHFIYAGTGGRGVGATIRGGSSTSSVSRGGFGGGGDGGGE